ncbi:hypothetical protein AMECASPLE_012667 [Ameca splendens]|uniref:Uncharacterized protein n=1 Tax=Ameca splendens TaxID=208324 RepID=A0ABV0YN86_9TELE
MEGWWGTCVVDNVDSSLLVHSFHRGLSNLVGSLRWNRFSIWEVRYGARVHMCKQVCLFLGRVGGEKTLHPQSERGKCLSGEVSMSATISVCVSVYVFVGGQRELHFPTGD